MMRDRYKTWMSPPYHYPVTRRRNRYVPIDNNRVAIGTETRRAPTFFSIPRNNRRLPPLIMVTPYIYTPSEQPLGQRMIDNALLHPTRL